MKIIDLLNKIANDEEIPNKIKVEDLIWKYNYVMEDYWCEEAEKYLMDKYNMMGSLNNEVEILEEEKKIPLKINKIIPSQNYVISDSKNNSVDERLEIIRKRLYANELYMLDIANTLNEIIDYLESKGE